MKDIGSWGRDGNLDAQWWWRTAPTVLLVAANADAQIFLTGVLYALGYRSDSSFVFGVDLKDGRFCTGPFNGGSPIGWVLRRLGRRPKFEYVIGVLPRDEDRRLFTRLTEIVRTVETVGKVWKGSYAGKWVPEQIGDPADMALKLAGAATEAAMDEHGYTWPPVRAPHGWVTLPG